MTACPGRARGLQPHDARHVAVRIDVPWTPAQGPVQVLVVHRCDAYGCPQRGHDWDEPARDVEAVLLKVLGPRGMLGPDNHGPSDTHDCSDCICIGIGEGPRPPGGGIGDHSAGCDALGQDGRPRHG